jgi:hypothetical protein
MFDDFVDVCLIVHLFIDRQVGSLHRSSTIRITASIALSNGARFGNSF